MGQIVPFHDYRPTRAAADPMLVNKIVTNTSRNDLPATYTNISRKVAHRISTLAL